jgi:uncharacterized protein (DUF488 family)
VKRYLQDKARVGAAAKGARRALEIAWQGGVPMDSDKKQAFTIGHSTRPLAAFIALLKAHAITHVADVRTVARSRHTPQFNRDSLLAALAAAGLGYTHLPGLGGLRRPLKNSPNQAWRNASFRGYADYMQTGEFARHLEELLALIRHARVAIMCAEAVPWRCHRSLIADALVVRGIPVLEILSATSVQPHRLTPWARVDGTRVSYPACQTTPAQESAR